MEQLTYYNSKFLKRIFPITLICDSVTNAANVGSLFRTADAFGIEKLIFCGTTIQLDRKMARTSRATEKVVNYEIKDDILDIIHNYNRDEIIIVSLEITNKSKPIHSVQFSNEKPIILVVGDENFGVSEAILKLSHEIVHIDMFGQNSSMNVVQATNIALYEITRQII